MEDKQIIKFQFKNEGMPGPKQKWPKKWIHVTFYSNDVTITRCEGPARWETIHCEYKNWKNFFNYMLEYYLDMNEKYYNDVYDVLDINHNYPMKMMIPPHGYVISVGKGK